LPATVGDVDAAARVLARLDRLDRLDGAGARPDEILAELRALVVEAEVWAREEGDRRALGAALELRRRAEGMSSGGPNG
jgi:hypothetical protein